ncbi:MAG TPA: hypothetical protein VGM70_08885 [Pseudolysinimonas sp.]
MPDATPVQQAFLDRVDAAVGIGTVGLALVVLLLAAIVVLQMRSRP